MLLKKKTPGPQLVLLRRKRRQSESHEVYEKSIRSLEEVLSLLTKRIYLYLSRFLSL